MVALAGYTHVNAANAQVDEAVKASFKRPLNIPFPASNPYSPEKVALGKSLFFDPRLSANNNQNCGSCHNPSFGWEDGQPVSTGTSAARGKRNSQTLLNRAWGKAMFWDGRADGLENQALFPIQDDVEMNMPIDELVEKLSDIDGYQEQFNRVFPDEGISGATIAKAIATFERTIVSGISPFDRWIEGDENALSPSQVKGFELFTGKANCIACHSGWNLTDEMFHDIGIDSQDMGRSNATSSSSDAFTFKTPGLRNIGQRAPFMHDGSMDTLDEVISHYIGGGNERNTLSQLMKPIDLDSDEVDHIVDFLLALTGEDRPVTLPILPY